MRKIHFIGIGGIGVSALARYFRAAGASVSGSDAAPSELLDELRTDGIKVFDRHEELHVTPDTDLVVYSAAVTSRNPELARARKLKIKTQTYAEALGELTLDYFTIAVSGSHGKSTTTALLSLMLVEAGFDPTIIIGTKLRELDNKNFRKGESKYLVIEADEWNKSFHKLFPKLVVLTNIDKEHLDTYKDFKGVVAGFERYLKNLLKTGTLVANYGDTAIRALAKKTEKRGVRVFFYNKNKFKKHPMGIPGAMNQLNAEAAWTAAREIGIKKETADKVLRDYTGSWRRMERLLPSETQYIAHVYSDYAHHPTEIKATLGALRERYPRQSLVCVFEPHQADRLARLFDDFVRSFDEADKVVILPAYKVTGREEKDMGKDAFALVQKILDHRKGVFYAPDFALATKLVKPDLEGNAVVVFMGAGTIDAATRKFFGI